MSAELLPCGHCGGHASFVKRESGMRGTLGHDSWHAVRCNVCGLTMGESDRRFRSRDEVASAWNRRALSGSAPPDKNPSGLPSDIAQNTDVRATVGEAIATASNGLILTGRQIRTLVDFVAPDGSDADQLDTEVVVLYCEARTSNEGEPMPAGLYACLEQYPEEGCIPLDADKGEASHTDQPDEGTDYRCVGCGKLNYRPYPCELCGLNYEDASHSHTSATAKAETLMPTITEAMIEAAHSAWIDGYAPNRQGTEEALRRALAIMNGVPKK